MGFDVHAFDPTRQLVLGGVPIAGAPGLAGWSDADALSHAIADALLGAGGLGDLGHHFPKDAVREGVSSQDLLSEVGRLVLATDYHPVLGLRMRFAGVGRAAFHEERIVGRNVPGLDGEPARVELDCGTRRRGRGRRLERAPRYVPDECAQRDTEQQSDEHWCRPHLLRPFRGLPHHR